MLTVAEQHWGLHSGKQLLVHAGTGQEPSWTAGWTSRPLPERRAKGDIMYKSLHRGYKETAKEHMTFGCAWEKSLKNW